MAGLPGTGLGGIFYVLLITWIFAREALLTKRDANDTGRWKRVIMLSAQAAAIIAAVGFQAWALHELVNSINPTDGVLPDAEFGWVVLLGIPFVILALLIGGIHLTRWTLERRLRPQASSVER